MIPSVEVTANTRTCFASHALLKKTLRNHSGCIAFFAQGVVAPHETTERYCGAIHQFARTGNFAQSIVGELSPLISRVNGDKAVCGVPFVGARGARCDG